MHSNREDRSTHSELLRVDRDDQSFGDTLRLVEEFIDQFGHFGEQLRNRIEYIDIGIIEIALSMNVHRSVKGAHRPTLRQSVMKFWMQSL